MGITEPDASTINDKVRRCHLAVSLRLPDPGRCRQFMELSADSGDFEGP